MSDLVVCNNFLFFRRNHSALSLVACQNHLNALHQILLLYAIVPHAYRTQRRFIDDIRKLRTGGTRGCPCDCAEINSAFHLDIFRMYLEDCLSALQIRQLHGNSSVESTGTQQCLIQCFGSVRCRQNNNTLSAVKAVHLRQQLVQCLLPLIVAAHAVAVTLFPDGINFINKYDTGCFFVCLLKKVAHLCRAHADKHFHKFRAGNGEEGNLCLTCNRLRQQCFPCSGRAYEQCALWHGCADFRIFLGIMQKIHNFAQCVLRFILPCNVLKGLARLRLHIYLRIRFPEGHRIADAAHLAHGFFHHKLPQQEEYNKHHKRAEPGGNLPRLHLSEGCPCVIQPLYQLRVIHPYGRVYLLGVLRKNCCACFIRFVLILQIEINDILIHLCL